MEFAKYKARKEGLVKPKNRDRSNKHTDYEDQRSMKKPTLNIYYNHGGRETLKGEEIIGELREIQHLSS